MTSGAAVPTFTNDHAERVRAYLGACPPQVLRDLLAIAPAVVALLDADLRIIYGNERDFGSPADSRALRDAVCGQGATARTMGASTSAGEGLEPAAGRPMPSGVLEERLAFIRQVLQTGASVAVTGVIRGRLTETVYTRLAGPSDEPAVLIIAFPINEFGPIDREAVDVGLRAARVRARNDDLGSLADLTERELQVLRLIGQGLTAAEIGQHLHRAVKTIEGHRVSLGTKLGLRGKAELVRTAIAAGLTALDDRELVLLAKQARLTRELS